MKRYRVPFTQTVSVTITVEVEDDATPEEVVEAAEQEGVQGVCAHCSGWGQDWSRDDDGELEPVMIDGKYELYEVED